MRNFFLALGTGFLFLGLPAAAYFFGLWIPNNPSLSQYPIRGVDVSRHQGRVIWNSVAKNGIRFVYIKATEGGDFQDAQFTENLRDARVEGLACGAYHFFSLKTSGAIQAENFIKTVPKDAVVLPPAIDLESWGNASARPSPEAFQAQLVVYIEAIRKAYDREPVIYTPGDFASVYLKNFPIKQFWVRDILFSPGFDGTKAWSFWQFTERAKVPGIKGFVDADVFNGSATDFEVLIKRNNP